MKILTIILTAVFIMSAAQADLIVRISHLDNTPQPPNPIIVIGTVTSEIPLKVSDGNGEIPVVNANGTRGQILRIKGNWDGSTLTADTVTTIKRPYPTVVFIGDSITHHPPFPAIGWYGSWGMQASAQNKDYVHLIKTLMQTANPANAVYKYDNVSAGQPGGKVSDALSRIITYKGYHADFIVVQLGENDGNITIEQFKTNYASLLDQLLDNNPVPRIFCFGVWNAGSSYSPTSLTGQQEAAIKELCDARNLPFRSLKDIAQNTNNYTPGGGAVGWHPNDNGMQGYADLFWNAMQNEF